MGLDITAFSEIKFLHTKNEKADHSMYHPYLYVNMDFPAQADGIVDGCYSFKEEFSFRAGSYCGYNEWRRHLSRMALHITPEEVWNDKSDQFNGKPFVELIHFADNEGIIGPKTSNKLLLDFQSHEEKAAAFDTRFTPADNEWFLRKYYEWLKAFQIASQNGCVHFH